MNNSDNNLSIDACCNIIADELGPLTADMYKEHFKNKDTDYARTVTVELISEILGESAAKKRINDAIN
jgi:hypothetical protein